MVVYLHCKNTSILELIFSNPTDFNILNNHSKHERKAPKKITTIKAGAIGIDINEHHLAITETDRTGNPINSFSIPILTDGKSTNQAKAIIGDASKQLVAYAVLKRKPLVIEKLDFQKKKATLSASHPKKSRM